MILEAIDEVHLIALANQMLATSEELAHLPGCDRIATKSVAAAPSESCGDVTSPAQSVVLACTVVAATVGRGADPTVPMEDVPETHQMERMCSDPES